MNEADWFRPMTVLLTLLVSAVVIAVVVETIARIERRRRPDDEMFL